MTFLLRTGLLILLLAGSASARADMIDTSGMAPWEVCALCHSLDGVSRMPKFPKLAGQRAGYIVKQFRDFHGGLRDNDGGQMQAITTEIAPEDLSAIAGYFSALSPPAPVPAQDAPVEAMAERLFREGREDLPACLSCHGSLDPDQPLAPWLEAQHAAYLAKQLTDFQNGNRSNDPDGVMRSIAARLSPIEIEALATYIAARKRPERTP